MQEAITELESLMRGQHIGNNSLGNLRISADGVEKPPIYEKSRVDLEIEKIKKALSDFANRVRSGVWGGDREEKKYQEKEKEIIEK